MKTCTKCRIEKPKSEFGKHKRRKDGLRSCCRKCNNDDAKAYRDANPDKVLQSVKRWAENNSERVSENNKAWRAANRERKLASIKAWRIANPDKVKAWADANQDKLAENSIRWKKNNPDKVSASNARWRAANYDRKAASTAAWRRVNYDRVLIKNQNRRARKREVGGTLSKDITHQLMMKQNGKCVYCQADLAIAKAHLDHRMPLKLGGTNSDDNMQLLCQRCNCRKGAKHPDDFERQIGYIK